MFVALALVVGALFVLPTQADAHTGSASVDGPSCPAGTKQAKLNVTNEWSSGGIAGLSTGRSQPVAAGATVYFGVTAGADATNVEHWTIGVDWPDHVHWDAPVSVDWGTTQCPAHAPTTTIVCPPGTHYSPIPPDVCPADTFPTTATTEVPPSSPPVSANVEATTTAPSPSVQPSVVSKPRPPAAQLPPTGSGPVKTMVAIALGALVGGLVGRALASRRRV